MPMKIGMVSLGCSKNQIDAEKMLHRLQKAGFVITPDLAEAHAAIVNTCGFIEDAKAEAVENILEAAVFKQDGTMKALIVTGCLAERYRDEILQEIPEVDAVVGLGSNKDIARIVQSAIDGGKGGYYGEKESFSLEGERVLSTPFYTAYLKIAEGCDNCCTYCAIPKIRGRFRSRKMEDILAEAKALVDSGVRELVLVAQDTTRYGEDLYGAGKLPQLLTQLCKFEGLRWLRVLYTYPERITDELLQVMATEDKVVPYLDIPIQHCNDEILKKMNRRSTKADLQALIQKIRRVLPEVTLRTTLITGFPGETEAQFEELCAFVDQMQFDRLGCFAYSAEEDTPAADFPDQVPQQVRVDRAECIMDQQSRIAEAKNQARIGTTVTVLVEGYDNYIKCYFGRSAADAPEVDGKVFFMSSQPLKMGDFVQVQINDTLEYDLLGEVKL